MTHAWCRDVARDAAVRAAEDNRTGPLPTLGEAIAAPFADAAERSSTVSKTGDGQSGLRTERVTLEITQFKNSGYKSPSEWDWEFFLKGESLTDGESVRVVDETHFDDLAQVAMERDAAIRERDALQARVAELEQSIKFCSGSCGFTASELGAKLAPHANADGESNHAAQAASGGGDHFADASKMVPQPRGWLAEEERKAVDAARDYFDDDDHGDSECVFIARVLKQILARLSPPEVVHPECHFDQFSGCSAVHAWNICAADFRKAIAAAGVAVKEVGRE